VLDLCTHLRRSSTHAYLRVMLGLSFANARRAVCRFVSCYSCATEVGAEVEATADEACAGAGVGTCAFEVGALSNIA